ncbi:hypothetical protein INR49_021717 [Caranx melampygus]|nr:hypothetical protein INR49_021717 [Caranx melampygus]
MDYAIRHPPTPLPTSTSSTSSSQQHRPNQNHSSPSIFNLPLLQTPVITHKCDSDNQRVGARRPAGEGAQEAGQIYWAASGRRTIRQGRTMPHSAGRSESGNESLIREV